jgi:hypothetical protein
MSVTPTLTKAGDKIESETSSFDEEKIIDSASSQDVEDVEGNDGVNRSAFASVSLTSYCLDLIFFPLNLHEIAIRQLRNLSHARVALLTDLVALETSYGSWPTGWIRLGSKCVESSEFLSRSDFTQNHSMPLGCGQEPTPKSLRSL